MIPAGHLAREEHRDGIVHIPKPPGLCVHGSYDTSASTAVDLTRYQVYMPGSTPRYTIGSSCVNSDIVSS